MIHKTGYRVWIFGETYWHRTVQGARKRAQHANATYAAGQTYITEISTGANIDHYDYKKGE